MRSVLGSDSPSSEDPVQHRSVPLVRRRGFNGGGAFELCMKSVFVAQVMALYQAQDATTVLFQCVLGLLIFQCFARVMLVVMAVCIDCTITIRFVFFTSVFRLKCSCMYCHREDSA